MNNVEIIKFIRNLYKTEGFIPLHAPVFIGNEKKYLADCIDSTFVSSVGKYVDEFEKQFSEYTNSKYAVACVNGTAALHVALLLAGVKSNDLVITQPLTFISTCNSISYLGASPLFIDVDKETLGLSPEKLSEYLSKNIITKDGQSYHKISKQKISACVPMHTFGHPCKIDQIEKICNEYNILLIEDSAESTGSYYKNQHTGTFGSMGVFSFNGNKTITCGGGGIIVTNDEGLATRAKHITTQAKMTHKWEFNHDEIGYNYRLPNINAALACAQLEVLPKLLENKRKTALLYKDFFIKKRITFVGEPADSRSNYWLNSILLENKFERDLFLEETNANGVMTRPAWILMNKLSMFKDCIKGDLTNAEWLEDRLVNIPSSYIK